VTTIDQGRLLQMRADIVGQNNALQRAAGHTQGVSAPSNGNPAGINFSDAIRSVNLQQSKASEMSEAYERGDTNDIVGVMVERQRASLSFEATLQVRNKLLSAYRDIMNMPV
jgi:flagellar hook-basal body complex protein FliE